MSRDRRYLHRIKSLFKKPTGRLVLEIVKMKSGDPAFRQYLAESWEIASAPKVQTLPSFGRH
ncbi:hypothetical protein BOX24_05210 [Leptospirillum ferriphilum]|uniref:Uncharacterized protein n=1 Tax=Leptospirillum ferriphilum TaxID=178606 RepID=A0A1V3SVM4_9BACT|nr:hypothetical protein BOX24_05210 [Leptospirillum ferriphilum]